MTEHLITWRSADEPRFEQARVEFQLGKMHARGTILVGGDDPYRADYELDTAASYVTRRLLVRAEGRGWSRELRLARDPEGSWTVRRLSQPLDEATSDVDLLDRALDCDLTGSPLTNTMPILRHTLHRTPGDHELVMAWVKLPELVVVRNGQRYEHLSGGLVRYSSGAFSADLVVDEHGLVVDYPGLAAQV